MGLPTRVWAKRSTALALAFLPSLSGCYIEQKYVVAPEVAAALTASPPPSIPADRETPKGKVAVRLRSSSLVGAPENGVVRSRAYSKMVTAGAVLTIFGSAISVVGAGLFWGTKGNGHIAGAVLAGSGEPFMIAGSALWVVGLNRYPQETRE